MTDLVGVWHAQHHNFTRLLDLLEKQVGAFHAGEQPDYDLMRDIVYYLRRYADQLHHPQEDLVFARLRERDPKMKPQTDRLVQQHRAIAAEGETLLKHLDAVVAGALEPRSNVEEAAAAFLGHYRQHLAVEEQEVIPRAAELLTSEDWAAVAAAVPVVPDPLFGVGVEARYRELARRIALEPQRA